MLSGMTSSSKPGCNRHRGCLKIRSETDMVVTMKDYLPFIGTLVTVVITFLLAVLKGDIVTPAQSNQRRGEFMLSMAEKLDDSDLAKKVLRSEGLRRIADSLAKKEKSVCDVIFVALTLLVCLGIALLFAWPICPYTPERTAPFLLAVLVVAGIFINYLPSPRDKASDSAASAKKLREYAEGSEELGAPTEAAANTAPVSDADCEIEGHGAEPVGEPLKIQGDNGSGDAHLDDQNAGPVPRPRNARLRGRKPRP